MFETFSGAALAVDEHLMKVSDLHLDLRNPRAGSEVFEDEDQAITRLIESADLDEIVRSIRATGWIDFEPLIVERRHQCGAGG